MLVGMDKDVQMVAEFMQNHFPAPVLVSVASGLNALAPVLWGHYPARNVIPLALEHDPCSFDDPHELSVAT